MKFAIEREMTNFHLELCGFLDRMLDYVINGFYKNSIIVFANVIPLQLDLSSDLIEVEQQCGLPPDTG